MATRKSYDDVAWSISTQIWRDWPNLLQTDHEIYNDIGQTLFRVFEHLEHYWFGFLGTGAFNICFKMNFTNDYAAVIRFPVPGCVMFPDEKVRNEVSIMQFVSEKASSNIAVPVPSVVRWAERGNNPSGLGPYIIMDYVPHKKSMSELLERPGRESGEHPVLNPDLEPARLAVLYGNLAKILLSLSTISLDRIGCLAKDDDRTWAVVYPPLSYSMNELVQLGTLPRSRLPTTTYEKASSYFEFLAELHLQHLISVRNEADIDVNVEGDVDILSNHFRRKFVARFLFQRIVQDHQRRKEWISYDSGPFPVWCDDLRPDNVLVDEAEHVAGVVDWEFTYTAPMEFSLAPPWWLLLKKPEDWDAGLDDWCVKYEKALTTFLIAMRRCEDESIQEKRLVDGQRLSSRMWASWQSGDFWIMYALRNNFAFDAVYWKKIDQRFFGPIPGGEYSVENIWRDRLHLLKPEEMKLMEEHVNLKVKDNVWKKLNWDADDHTKSWMEILRQKKDERGNNVH